ncbi:bet1-like SNARE 1-1 [Arachis ipaensis]|uniref:bet1-like SNARE 1-1 n=1 Tax=Arachis ipaensis TaxID=130454 RepID=UPI000A2B7080|nr:bet1-like SNARE 1-1 [Arachis ipaensis]
MEMSDGKTVKLDARNSRVALFDGIEEGGIRASSLYSSYNEIDEQDNERVMGGLQDRVSLLKRISSDIHEEVDSHNRMLDRMGNDMDSSRGVLSGTVDKFKMVFEKKSSRRTFSLIASFVVLFLITYFFTVTLRTDVEKEKERATRAEATANLAEEAAKKYKESYTRTYDELLETKERLQSAQDDY